MFVFLLIEVSTDYDFLPLLHKVTDLAVNLWQVAYEVLVFVQDQKELSICDKFDDAETHFGFIRAGF